MKPIVKALLELRTVLFSIGMFNSLVDSFIVFLFVLLGVVLLGLPWEVALVPGVIYFVIHTRKTLQTMGYTDVERRVPQLNEALRTAADSAQTENEVVQSLHSEVLEKMRLVQTSAFIGFGKVTRQLLVIALLCFVVISVSALNVHFLDATSLLEKAGVIGEGGGLFGGDTNSSLFARLSKRQDGNKLFPKEVTLIDDTELYGNASIIELGTDELNLELNAMMSGVKIGDVNDPSAKKFTDQTTPTDIQASSDAAFTEEIPKEYQGIVRNYFKAIPK